MRDKTHLEELERWANYVKNNPDKWRAKLKPFLDSQIIMARRFYKKLTEKNIEKAEILKNSIISP